ncbi:MAG: DUF6817 domain-containing protein [Vicinamibacterales bacterium]
MTHASLTGDTIPRRYADLLDELDTAHHEHSDATLRQHLLETYALLKDWGNPDEVCVAGLFHSIYGTQWYPVESAPMTERERIAGVIGKPAEELAFLFCATDRADLWQSPGDEDVTLRSRIDEGRFVVSRARRRDLLEIEIANTVEQLDRVRDPDSSVLDALAQRIQAFAGEISRGAYDAATKLVSKRSTSDPIAGGATALEYLLAPLRPDVFLSEFWARKPLYIRGWEDKFRSLFTLERLEAGLQSDDTLTVRASFDGGRTQVRPDPADAMTLYRAGATICVNDVARIDPSLGRLAAAVRAQLNFIGGADVRAYLSPDGQGYDMHFDSRVATTLQISGRKRWRFSTGVALPWPHYQVRSGAGDTLVTDYRFQQPVQDWDEFVPPTASSFEEVMLEPGDVLCLPAGTWHSAEAIGHSLALNLAFGSAGMWDVLEPVIAARVRTRPPWREPPPLVLTQGIHCGQLPPDIDAFFKARIAELIHVLEDLAADTTSLGQSWHRLVVHGSAAGAAAASTPPEAPNRSVTPATRLRRRAGAPVAYGFGPGPHGERRVLVYGADPPVEIAYSENALPFLERAFTETEFVAGDTLAWRGDGREYSWQSARALLDDLLACGAIDIQE